MSSSLHALLCVLTICSCCTVSLAAAESLRVGGSTTLTELFVDESKADAEKATGMALLIQPSGSSAGVKDLAAGNLDVAMASRGLKDTESADGMVGTTVGFDAIAVIVNANNGVGDLSKEQVAKIFTGEITNWSDVGGDAGRIVIITRNESSGTHKAFQKMALGKDGSYSSKSLKTTSQDQLIERVGKLKGAISYCSMGAVTDKVKSLAIGGVVASAKTLGDKSYPYGRPLLLITKGAAAGKAKKYIDWMMSEAGQIHVSKKAVAAK